MSDTVKILLCVWIRFLIRLILVVKSKSSPDYVPFPDRSFKYLQF
jgi:hypothetical protein